VPRQVATILLYGRLPPDFSFSFVIVIVFVFSACCNFYFYIVFVFQIAIVLVFVLTIDWKLEYNVHSSTMYGKCQIISTNLYDQIKLYCIRVSDSIYEIKLDYRNSLTATCMVQRTSSSEIKLLGFRVSLDCDTDCARLWTRELVTSRPTVLGNSDSTLLCPASVWISVWTDDQSAYIAMPQSHSSTVK